VHLCRLEADGAMMDESMAEFGLLYDDGDDEAYFEALDSSNTFSPVLFLHLNNGRRRAIRGPLHSLTIKRSEAKYPT